MHKAAERQFHRLHHERQQQFNCISTHNLPVFFDDTINALEQQQHQQPHPKHATASLQPSLFCIMHHSHHHHDCVPLPLFSLGLPLCMRR